MNEQVGSGDILIARLKIIGENLTLVITEDKAASSKLIDKTLDYLRIIRGEIRRLETLAKRAEVVGKPKK